MNSPIRQAVCAGDLAAVVASLEAAPAQLNFRDKEGRTPLLLACALEKLEIVDWLLDRGAKMTEVDRWSRSPLLCAVESGNVELVKLLLCHGASFEEIKNDIRAVSIAASNGHVAMLQFLVDQGLNVRDQGFIEGAVMSAAASHGHIAILEFLLSQGCSIHSRDASRQTPILAAAVGGQIETFKFLLEQGANPDDVTDFGVTAFLLASLHGQLEMVRYLLDNGLSSPNEKCHGGAGALLLAVEGNHPNVVQFLVENNLCHPTDVIKDNRTALHEAAFLGRLEIVKVLLAQGISADLKLGRRATPLRLAVVKGHHQVVLALLDHGADITFGKSLAATAGANCDIEMLRVLGAMGADLQDGVRCAAGDLRLWLKHVQHYSPMQIACEARRPDLIRRVLRRGGKAIDGLDVALRHDSHVPFSLKVCKDTVAFVKNAMKWQPENHALFSNKVQRRVVNCLLVLEAVNEETEDLHLPNEVMYLMLAGFPSTSSSQ